MGLGKTVEVLACLLSNPKNTALRNSPQGTTQITGTPIIKKQSKMPERSDYTEEIIRNPEPKPLETLRSNKNDKNGTRAALQKWYMEMLGQVNYRPPPRTVESNVRCICGYFDTENLVVCKFCSKRQHSDCVGYKKSFGKYICAQCWKTQVGCKFIHFILFKKVKYTHLWGLIAMCQILAKL